MVDGWVEVLGKYPPTISPVYDMGGRVERGGKHSFRHSQIDRSHTIVEGRKY